MVSWDAIQFVAVVVALSFTFYNYYFFYSLISLLFTDAIYIKVNISVQCLITLVVLMQINTNLFQKRNSHK